MNISVRLFVKREGQQWVVAGLPEYWVGKEGPFTTTDGYPTKKEAEEACRGMAKFFDSEDASA